MARRIPLPRLTQRQRTARWQRERRQQFVVVVVFSAILFFVIGLASWAAADRYYGENLEPAARYGDVVLPIREVRREMRYQLVPFFLQNQIPAEFEDDEQLDQSKAQFEGTAVQALLEQAALDTAAARDGVTIEGAAIDQRYVDEHSQYGARHVLVSPAADATDTAAADKAAQEEALFVAAKLRAAPNDQDLWNTVAKESSDDPGSKDSGGELGFVSKGDFVKEFEDAALRLPTGEISEPVKSQFGWHVIQVTERRGPEENERVKRYLASGFIDADVKAHVRFGLLREELERRAQEAAVSGPPPVQLHLATITLASPAPAGGDVTAFTEALRKISEVSSELEKGTDFAEVAKKYSEDADAQSGGDAGWYAPGMLDLETDEKVFGLEVGQQSQQITRGSQIVIYKVLEKATDRPLAEEQTTAIKAGAYQYWLAREMRAHDARSLLTE